MTPEIQPTKRVTIVNRDKEEGVKGDIFAGRLQEVSPHFVSFADLEISLNASLVIDLIADSLACWGLAHFNELKNYFVTFAFP